MNQQEATGALAEGGRFRATSYMVEVMDPAGAVLETVDANDIKEVQRKGETVTIKRRKGKDVVLRAVSLDDAGRLEGVLRSRGGPAPQVVVKKGGIPGFFRWGCGGLLGLIVIVVIVVVVSSSGSKNNTSTSGGSTSGPASGKDVREAFAEGSSATVKTAGEVTIKLTIDKITDPAVSTNQFEKPAAGNRFLTVAFTIENAGQRESRGGDFLLRTADGFEYKQKFVSGVGAGDLNALQTLTSGGKVKTVIAFEVPEGAMVQWLKFDPNPFASGDLYFERR